MTRIEHSKCRLRQSGVSLVELMVALTLGVFLILGAVTVYNQSRSTYRVTEAVARLQETGRYAFDILEPEVRMASYWGLNNRADYLQNRAAPGETLPPIFTPTQGTAIARCGSNWAINLAEYIGGSNNTYSLGCQAFSNSPHAGSDVLVIRRGGEQSPGTMATNRLYVQASRIQGTLFVPASAACLNPENPACLPAGYAPPASETREVFTHAYYIANGSTGQATVPSLRRKRFIGFGGTLPTDLADDEIIPGVEDLQVQFGVDGVDADTNIDAYVNPGGVGANQRVISATIWLRIRAIEPDFSFVDGNTYQYADMATAFNPTASATAIAGVTCPGGGSSCFRRIVISKTIQLRNANI
jgi:type IV pilus assembly protein PilW